MRDQAEPAGTKGRRVDAQRNRARLLEAAGEMFAESGLNVPMSEIARRAGVGIATLARNFDTREAIIEATFAPDDDGLRRCDGYRAGREGPMVGVLHVREDGLWDAGREPRIRPRLDHDLPQRARTGS